MACFVEEFPIILWGKTLSSSPKILLGILFGIFVQEIHMNIQTENLCTKFMRIFRQKTYARYSIMNKLAFTHAWIKKFSSA